MCRPEFPQCWLTLEVFLSLNDLLQLTFSIHSLWQWGRMVRRVTRINCSLKDVEVTLVGSIRTKMLSAFTSMSEFFSGLLDCGAEVDCFRFLFFSEICIFACDLYTCRVREEEAREEWRHRCSHTNGATTEFLLTRNESLICLLTASMLPT